MKIKTNDKFKKIILFFLIIFLCFTIFANKTHADVGSFESYDSGSSSWGSSSSWDSSWDSSDYSGGGFLFFGNNIWGLIIAIVIVAIIFASNKGGPQNISNIPNLNRKTENEIIEEIKAHDELFNKDEIISWSKNLFVKLQQAWSKRDWSEIRVFETNSLFEQHKNQLQGYIDNGTINIMDRICVNYANLYDYRISGDKEILIIKLNSRMKDYIIDAETKKVIKGDPNIERTNNYLLTFERKMGVKTKPGTIEVNTTNCPNCGAPTQITSSGKCGYCGSVITTGQYNWCLSNLERAQY